MIFKNFIMQINYTYFGSDLFYDYYLFILFLDGALGAPIFSLKGNQGQGWKPATVRYIGSADSVEVSFILSVKKLWVSF